MSSGISSDKFVIDTYAWYEYFTGSKAGEKAKKYIESGSAITPTIVIAELSAKYSKEKISSEERMRFIKVTTRVVPLTDTIADNAGNLRTTIRKKIRRFGLADAVILATAHHMNAKIITGDPHFRSLKNVINLQ